MFSFRAYYLLNISVYLELTAVIASELPELSMQPFNGTFLGRTELPTSIGYTDYYILRFVSINVHIKVTICTQMHAYLKWVLEIHAEILLHVPCDTLESYNENMLLHI